MNEPDWRARARAQFSESIELPARFFEANADSLARACCAMAERFQRGGRLLVFGGARSTTDAQHVAVEFVHPVIVGKRALPALALSNDIATALDFAAHLGLDDVFAEQLRILGRHDDIALGLMIDDDRSVWRGLDAARALGMLTIGLSGAAGMSAGQPGLDFYMAVPSDRPAVVQEVQETAYHILWETVHVFFEHAHLLGEVS